ncbi:hypothetical protein BASA61_009967 [Batrachochytrium salamandrivorans]|nr:hypothetical protein BASA61_009967 [Batrachochytrium salamandrivorans]KAH9246712.1 hypothetical protein BASA81_015716 [Batrachochytrium salamandrivorans]KAH9267866.1 hypothetical protein BASA83_009691 [Batrachochytrium salamandrivorans]
MDNLDETCSDLGFIKKLLKTARSIDDNVIPKLNGLSTRADHTASCQQFFEALSDSYLQRNRLIHSCIDIVDTRIANSKNSISQGNSTLQPLTRSDEILKQQLVSELTVEDIVRSRTHRIFTDRCRSVSGTSADIWSI